MKHHISLEGPIISRNSSLSLEKYFPHLECLFKRENPKPSEIPKHFLVEPATHKAPSAMSRVVLHAMPTPYVVVGDIMLLKLTDVLYPHQISHSGEKACLLSCLRATRGQGANTRAYAWY